MKLLILTQYFPPETGAPQNRLFELAMRFKAMGVEVQVLTAMPNYPKAEIFEGYKGKKYLVEDMNGLVVHRTSIYVSRSRGLRTRLINYFSFVLSSYRRGKKLGDFDYILCESPPLFLGYSAMWLSNRLKAKLIFNVSDLWPESAEKLGLVSNKLFLKLAYNLEAKCYRKSYLITGQTQGIVEDIRRRFPDKDVYWLPNGVNLAKYNPEKVHSYGLRARYGISENDIVFFYGGILGHAQGLDLIINVAKRVEDIAVKFVLMGSGPVKENLINLAAKLGVTNVVFAEPVSREEIMGVISDTDVSLIPLKKIDLFLGAIPSKIFEALAMEKPILLGVNGEARDLFIEKGNAGWFFEPENADDLESKIRTIRANPQNLKEFGKNGRQYVVNYFNRNKIAEEFFNYLVYQVIHKPIDTPDKPKISISVIIPCRNEENHIGSCIDGIYASALNGLEIEVLLIDGMSTDKTLDIVSQMQLKYPSLRVIANRLQVTPIAFNIGIKEAKGDFIQIVGARQIISPNYLLEAKRILTEMKDIWCVGGLVQNIYQNNESEVIGLAMASPFGVGGKNFRVLKKSDYTDTVGTPMYPRWVFKKIGLFNEALVRNQDDELNYRVSSSGGKIFLNADIQIKYYVRAKISNLFKQYYQYGYWKVFVNQMHSTITSTRQLVPLFFVLGLISGAVLSIFSVILAQIYLSFLLVYVVLTVSFGIRSAGSLSKGLQVAKVFPVLHFSYGWGYLKGLIDFVILRRKPAGSAGKLSR